MIKTLSIISTLSVFIPFVAGLFFVNKKDRISLHFLFFIGITSISESLSIYMHFTGMPSLPKANLYLIFSTVYLLFIYSQSLREGRMKTVFNIINVLCITIGGINIILMGIDKLNHYNFIFLFTVLNIASAYILLNLITDMDEPLFTKPVFWIAGSTFIYCTSTIMLYALSDYIIVKAGVLHDYYRVFHFFVNVTVNILYAVTFICRRFNKAIS